MIAERWEQIKALFEDAFDRSPEQRQKFLECLELEDPAAAREVVRLLRSYEEAGDFLLQPCTVPLEFLEDFETEQYRFASGDIICGRFRIIELIGQGGMGEVYKACDEELEDLVALKTLRSETSTHELFATRFRREIQLARKVTHPNVCRIFDSFKHQLGEGIYLPVLSMEFLQGQTIAEYLKNNGKISVSEALPIARQIIGGLNAIHAAGIVHRDLKPANLIMAPLTAKTKVLPSRGDEKEESRNQSESHFQIKITDFGIASQIPDELSAATQSEASKLLGTPDYMAPEQLEHGRASIQSDIYSLGLVLYQMITGAKAFDKMSAWKRLTADPPSPRKIVSNLPENWDKTILCCLERNPAYRFQSVRHVLSSLEAAAFPDAIPRKPFPLRLKHIFQSQARSIAIFSLLLVAFGAGFYRYIKLKPENVKTPEGPMIMLTSIVNQSKDPQLNGVTYILRNQLAQSAYLNPLDEASVHETLRQMVRPDALNLDPAIAREVAMRNGALLVVFGTVNQDKSNYILNLELDEVGNEPERARRTWQFTEHAFSKKELLGVVDQSSVWIRRTVGEAAGDLEQRNRKPEDVTTDNWEALQLYSEGQRMAAQDRLEDAVSYFKQATDKDKNFAMAWMRAGDVLDTLGNLAEGLKCWQKALAVSGIRRLSRREELRIEGMFASDTGDLKSAADSFRQYSLDFPTDYLGPLNRSYAVMMQGDTHVKEAIQLLKSAGQLNRNSYYIADHLAQYNLIAGNLSDVDHSIARLRELGHPEYADQIEGQAGFLRGQYQHARQLFQGLRSSQDSYLKSVSYYLEAALLAEQGQYTESIAVLKQGIDADQTAGDSADCADKWLALAYLYMKKNMPESGREAALKSLEAESGPRRMADAGMLLARNGFIAEARRVLEKLPTDDSLRIFQVARLRLQGEILLATGHPKEAFSVLEKTRDLEDERALLHDYWVRALLAVHRTDEALRELKALQQYPGMVWHQPEFYPPGYAADLTFEYATLAMQLDKAAAATRLTEYLELRKAAAPDLPEVAKARAMLRDLQQSPTHSISN